MNKIELKDTEARGRSGWFKARTAQVSVYDSVISSLAERPVRLNIESSRPSFPGPVYLEMRIEDARALGEAIVAVASEAARKVQDVSGG